MSVSHLESDHPQSECVRFICGEPRPYIHNANELGVSPSPGSRTKNVRRLHSSSANELGGHPCPASCPPSGKPETTETRTARPVNENIILWCEMVRLLLTEIYQGKKLRRTPFRYPHTISRECKNDKPRLMSSIWGGVNSNLTRFWADVPTVIDWLPDSS